MASVNNVKKQLRKAKKQASRANSESLEQMELLPWTNSATGIEDDPSAFIGSNNELEEDGGFFLLEEIDEKDYRYEIPKLDRKSRVENSDGKTKSKKRKRQKGDDETTEGGNDEILVNESNKVDGGEVQKKAKKKTKTRNKKEKKKGDDEITEGGNDGRLVEESNKVEGGEVQKKAKRKTKTGNKKEKKNELLPNDALKESATVLVDGSQGENGIEEDPVDENDYFAWNKLRLHPLLMKSIMRLKFKEPTPIQERCIPAAAHQGKDVIGAAETGSGKTLAFGLPILQRLLEEREKTNRLIAENGETDRKNVGDGCLRALIITPTRELALQVTAHLKEVAKGTNIRVVPVVGGMASQKQERVLKSRPEVVVGTPGRLWELMSGGAIHLVELHSLSFFVLDEADRMIENGHFRELQSIIDMLPMKRNQSESQIADEGPSVSSIQKKKRQTFLFSATLALPTDFRKKLKRGSLKSKLNDGLSSIETLSERAGIRENVDIIDLTNASILVGQLTESFIQCTEENKDAYLYYILGVHGKGRTIIFCTSIAALRHISSLLRVLGVNVWTYHGKMQQRARLKAVDRFRSTENGILVAADVAARGLDIPGVRTVIHYQLPHSPDVYVHRSGRTARAHSDGCSIALISPNETSNFAVLCREFGKESFQQFPIVDSYMPEVTKRVSLARQIDKILSKDSQKKAEKSWFERNAASLEMDLDDNDSEDERAKKHRQKKAASGRLLELQQELKSRLSRPLQPKTFSSRYLAGAGVSPLLQLQLEELAVEKQLGDASVSGNKMAVIGQDCVEPLHALKNAGHVVCMDPKVSAEKKKNAENLRRKRKEEKKRLHDQRRKQKKRLKEGI